MNASDNTTAHTAAIAVFIHRPPCRCYICTHGRTRHLLIGAHAWLSPPHAGADPACSHSAPFQCMPHGSSANGPLPPYNIGRRVRTNSVVDSRQFVRLTACGQTV